LAEQKSENVFENQGVVCVGISPASLDGSESDGENVGQGIQKDE
jgi:hypothetical protein